MSREPVTHVPADSSAGETLREFTHSFACGASTDLPFRFIERLPDAEAAEFLRSLLEKPGQTKDRAVPALCDTEGQREEEAAGALGPGERE